MPNRYYSDINGRLSAPLPPKDERKSRVPSYPTKTRDWNKPSGPVGPKRNTVGFPEVKQYVTKKLADDRGREKPVSKAKAKKILEDKEIRGKPLTEKQRGLFGLIASGGTPSKRKGFKG